MIFFADIIHVKNFIFVNKFDVVESNEIIVNKI